MALGAAENMSTLFFMTTVVSPHFELLQPKRLFICPFSFTDTNFHFTYLNWVFEFNIKFNSPWLRPELEWIDGEFRVCLVMLWVFFFSYCNSVAMMSQTILSLMWSDFFKCLNWEISNLLCWVMTTFQIHKLILSFLHEGESGQW